MDQAGDSPPPAAPAPRRVRVWDLPTRLFHWSLVGCVIASFVTAELGGDLMAWHFRLGYTALALLLFRLVWGFVGTHHARFANFPPSLRATLAYLRGKRAHGLGHNPLGAWSVYAMLTVLLFQAVSGLFANDDVMWDGPLRRFVSDDTSHVVSVLHRSNQFLMYALIGLHVAALAFYALVRKQRLVPAMVTGDKQIAAEADAPAVCDTGRQRALALAVFAIAAAVVAVIANLGE